MLGIALIVLLLCFLGLTMFRYLEGEQSGIESFIQAGILFALGCLIVGATGCGPSADDIKDDCNGPNQYLACVERGYYSEQCCCSSFDPDQAVNTRCS